MHIKHIDRLTDKLVELFKSFSILRMECRDDDIFFV